MGSQSRNHLAMDAQTRQADAMERIALALERLAVHFTPLYSPANPDLTDPQIEDFDALIDQETHNGAS